MWEVEAVDGHQCRFRSPNGYVLEFLHNAQLIGAALNSLREGAIITTNGDVIETQGNQLVVQTSDIWVNPGWVRGDNIGTSTEFVEVVLRYLERVLDDSYRLL